MKSAFVTILSILISQLTSSQTISGRISDYFSKKPLDGVSVQTSSGHFAISDSLGNYSIAINKKDSLWFTYFSKQTVKYPIDTIAHPENFDIALYVDAQWLPEVKVATRNYRLDSLQNRENYANAFNFRKPGLRLSQSDPSAYSPGGLTVGFDLDEIINAFRFRHNREMSEFQERLIQQEHDKYIDHRYTKYLVKKLTNLDGKQLDDFMNYYRPSYELMLIMNDLELGYYIEQCYKDYQFNNNQIPAN